MPNPVSSEQVIDLTEAVIALRDEIRCLGATLDEIRDALQWQNNNAADYPQLIFDRQNFWHAELPTGTQHKTVPVSTDEKLDSSPWPTRQKTFFDDSQDD